MIIMGYHRILFCIPPITKKPRAPFVGIGYLSTFLTFHGIENDVIDMTLGYKAKDLFKKIESQKPDLVAFFLMTHKYEITYNLIYQVQKKYGIDTVIGGPHVSTLRKQSLKESDATFAIKLEGEYTLLDLIKGKKLKEIDGLIYRNNGIIMENPDRKFIHNLDNIPFPTYEKFELKKYHDTAIPIVTSRGCPYNCIYCPVKAAIGKQFRMRNAENVLEEIEYWYEKGYRKFDFQDDNFTLKPERVKRICSIIKEKRWNDLILNCPNGVRADKIDRDLLTLMRNAGFKTLAFGVEAGNNRILKNIKKGEKIETIENAINDACGMGFDVILFFLVGSPGETVLDVEDSIKLALKYPIIDAFFYSLVPYPETKLYDWVKKNNYFIVDPDKYLSTASGNTCGPLFATPEFPSEERERILKLTKKIRREIRKKSIIRRYGFSGRLFADIFSSDFADKHLINNKFFSLLYDRYLMIHGNQNRNYNYESVGDLRDR